MAGLRVWCDKVYQTKDFKDFKDDLTTNGFSLLQSDKWDGADVVILAPPGSNADELTAMGRIVIEVSAASQADCDKFNAEHRMTGHRKISEVAVEESGKLTGVLRSAVKDYDNVHTLRNTMVELYGVLQRAQVTSVNRLMARLGVPAPSALVVPETDVDTKVIEARAERLAPPAGALTSLDPKVCVLYMPREGEVYFDEEAILSQSLTLPLVLAVTREHDTKYDVPRMQQVRQYQEINPTAMLALVMYYRPPGDPVGRQQHLDILADGVDQLNMRAHTSLMSQLPPRSNWFVAMKTLFDKLDVSSEEFYSTIMNDPTTTTADSTPGR